MEEIIVSSEGEMELQVLESEIARSAVKLNRKRKITADGAGIPAAAAAAPVAGNSSSPEVMWGNFLPKMAVRVLLVEADDSTRQIVAALLRKCSYKVAAVSDGLKAWEVLKERSHNIDLILTEVELPSISGYALLTLIMEHDICKNIPVIMMSSQDSVSTVYKCMLRGAADFLVKPLRKNELRNLWQHVWRRQASIGAGPGPPEETGAQQKLEATAENNDISNNSSHYMTCIKKNKECIEKGSDTQSSCTRPELDNKGADTEKAVANVDANCGTTQGQDKNSDDVIGRDSEKNNSRDVPESSSRGGEAIDLLGAFDNYLKGNFGNTASIDGTNKFDNTPVLDLSLRRSHPSGSVNQVNDETRRLKQSDASAFSRYVNNDKTLQPQNATSASTCNQQKDTETSSKKQQSNHILDYNYDFRPIDINQSGIPETTFSYTQKRDSFAQLNPFYPSSSKQVYNLLDQSGNSNFGSAIDHTDGKQGQKSEDLERVSPSNYQSGNSNFGSGNSSLGNVNEECFHVQDGPAHRSMLREAALTKFRMKRKDRCFEKKVRYESRKQLAEQRPRVKGQFVRQLPNDSQTETSLAS
ncbi:hypothetical protein MIMGU_mgv1a003461mg [Erythranthe guttata]|uniref:Uncharacterized protein n=1 Tax=Erythranthe guttata TaxID=4155 RepID=A0A022PTL0_ERYGU|nr:hypothetical protein MIMGU_mgv1a003461mg [Erythranthe guttata]